jgi:son of sevenless-like protein
MNKGDLTKTDPDTIARHLTLLESKLYLRITSNECLNWAKVQTGETVTNIYAFRQTHDRITKWVKTTVLLPDGHDNRANEIEFWIKAAEVCVYIVHFYSWG